MIPTSNFVNPMLTDKYQLTMAYCYWKAGRHNMPAVFDLFFRKNPFGGEFTIFAGLEEFLRLMENFYFTQHDIEYLRDGKVMEKEEAISDFEAGINSGWIRESPDGYEIMGYDGWGEEVWRRIDEPKDHIYIPAPMPNCETEFFNYLMSLDCSKINISAMPEGTLAFPREPLISVRGPLAVGQLLETPALNMINFASLMATNAARFRLAAGWDKGILEFGLRRAQGPDGAMSASRYSYLGGFDATSNVQAGKIFGIPIKGTHAHALIQGCIDLSDIRDQTLRNTRGERHNFVYLVSEVRKELGFENTNTGELAAMILYAQAFPDEFLALVDTYDTLASGVPNFICVAVVLSRLGYKPIGIRLDSGDLAYLSKEARIMFIDCGSKTGCELQNLAITASNDINENILHSLKEEGHEIDTFGIGTHAVTCQAQPALGGVYKLVEINGISRIKLSEDRMKITIPGEKDTYRLIGMEGTPLLDIMVKAGEEAPKAENKILCRDPFNEEKRALVTPSKVVPLKKVVWAGRRTYPLRRLNEIRDYILYQIKGLRTDHLRALNPSPYKISVSEELYKYIHDLWQREAPVKELH